MQSIYLGGGCFWCTEAIFKKVKGVKSVTLGILEVKQLIQPMKKFVVVIQDMWR